MKKLTALLCLFLLPLIAMENDQKRLKPATDEEIIAEHERMLAEHLEHIHQRQLIVPPALPYEPGIAQSLHEQQILQKQPLNTQLLIAAQYGDSAKIQDLVARGADINSGQKNPIMIGESARQILITPLAIALLNKQHDAIDCILKLGGKPTYRDLENAIDDMKYDIALEFIAHGAPIVSDQAEPFHRTLLMRAVQIGNENLCRALILHGANLNDQGPFGQTALIIAVLHDHEEICKLLLSHGADINIHDCYGTRALGYAANRQSANLIQLLCEYGADPNTQDSKGRTILLDSCDCFQFYNKDVYNTFQLLLEYGANPNIPDREGVTPLMNAALLGFDELVNLLLQYDADHTLRNNERTPALEFAQFALDEELENDSLPEQLNACHSIIQTLSNPDTIHAVKTRRENNPRITNALKKTTRTLGAHNIYNALFNREIGNK